MLIKESLFHIMNNIIYKLKNIVNIIIFYHFSICIFYIILLMCYIIDILFI